MIFDEEFIRSSRERKPYPFPHDHVINSLSEEAKESFMSFDWNDALELLDSHPEDHRVIKKQKMGFVCTALERRESNPLFAKEIISNLKQTFQKNSVTCHMFGGFTNQSKSFQIHRDVMDVLYLQVVGEIHWSAWEPKDENNTPENIPRDDANCIYREKFVKGRMFWIPRHKYHYVEPVQSRIGFSFGVEGKTDPSTYI